MYVLINGQRYYRDDQTGRTTLDNVSEADAQRRARGNWNVTSVSPSNRTQSSGVSNRTSDSTSTGSRAVSGRTTGGTSTGSRAAGSAGGVRYAANATSVATARTPAGVPWKAVVIWSVILLFVGAFFYNRSHTSLAEQAIARYMSEQAADSALGGGDVQEESEMETTAADEGTYLMPDSASRYLAASEIEGLTHDELQLRINEIYARHGQVFGAQKNIDYFSAQDWYEATPGKSSEQIWAEFNDYEKANVLLLCEYR